MGKVVHIIGNGPSAGLTYNPSVKGLKYTCNLPPFSVPEAKATFMVDFKMMKAITDGSVTVPGEWILGFRPKKWTEVNPRFYLKYAPQIKEFYLDKPTWVRSYTDFNCGHTSAHYAAHKLKAEEVHMYGFDSIFDLDLRSCTDFYLNSDRGTMNNTRLSGNWRPIWHRMWKESPDTKFILYHHHSNIKTPPVSKNVEIVVVPKGKKR